MTTTAIPIEDLLDGMHEAAKGGRTVQSRVRDLIASRIPSEPAEDIANCIASAIGVFKTSQEGDIVASFSKEERGPARKVTNNIINDVSRIVREVLGYSIVNKKRTKGVYDYEAVWHVPTPRGKAPSAAAAPAEAVCVLPHFDRTKHMAIPKDAADACVQMGLKFGGEFLQGTDLHEMLTTLCRKHTAKVVAKSLIDISKSSGGAL